MARIYAVFTSFNCYFGSSTSSSEENKCLDLDLEGHHGHSFHGCKKVRRVSDTDSDDETNHRTWHCGRFFRKRKPKRERDYGVGPGVMLISMKQETLLNRVSDISTSTGSPGPLLLPRGLRAVSVSETSSLSSCVSLEDARLEFALASTMLQQILRDMYIEPELLAELDEEQKQVLFCKMREEQVRRWKEREMMEEEKKKNTRLKKTGRKHVDFLEGADGKPWTWVMGEHGHDKSIEQILEEEAQDNAHKLAEQEAEELRKLEEEKIQQQLQEEQERIEREQKEKEEELKRQADAAALYQSRKEAREAAEKLEQERKKEEEEKQKKLQSMKARHELHRQRSTNEIQEMKRQRSSELYMSFKEARHNLEKQAEETSRTVDEAWLEQEKRARQADEEKRAIARRARAEHRKSFADYATKTQIIGMVMTGFNARRSDADANDNDRPSVPPRNINAISKTRPPKPPNRQAVVEWFREVERVRGVGTDGQSDHVAPWFHGIISRQRAEELLNRKPTGTFLVRVSERVWGYAISYKGSGRCKHFLIDATEGSYQFFGTNQIAHPQLINLVLFHKTKPISGAGQEFLLYPCGQTDDPPDYFELFEDSDIESSYL